MSARSFIYSTIQMQSHLDATRDCAMTRVILYDDKLKAIKECLWPLPGDACSFHVLLSTDYARLDGRA